MSAEELAATIQGAMPEVKSGSLRFFGEWFGRPWDNVHRMVAVAAQGDRLRLTFDEGETLDVWEPGHLDLEPSVRFVIRSASKLRWEWFSYGRSRSDENRYFIEYREYQGGIQRESDWPTLGESTIDPKEPAVSIN